MTFKVAVASTDNENINEHFGKAKRFLIYKIKDDGSYEFLENRENNPPCNNGKHEGNIMIDSVDLIEDVSILLVSNVGPGAIDLLISKEIKPYVTSFTIEDGLKEISVLEKELHQNND
ncbi:dinitrogenase iron-molybdenum cofactor biosynthesis protein [Methanobrevibacter sp. TMH8]|uniref:NifB/NifX family molybdenum-iron cluster-binding protein n=1 Tax=Methanobrevibacter sp. TMH8 TaxID=2848611 RepID=UPI001CCD34F5|nr:NifB/NifX family molybdenum-iron cluster-binding protein [Methanobrevibacter sp. TMH8]MBZ9570208.1 dinitrogenase iron-molybdenum cofactor biosynthesis protein [Methanobrevibacter sp. TMH8]